jgi:hypothetical protein
MTVSSNEATPNTGIVWVTAPRRGDANHHRVPGIVLAYTATQLDGAPVDPFTDRLKLIWDSTRPGVTFCKFCPPVVVERRLLVPTCHGFVDVYGPSPQLSSKFRKETP